MHSLMQFYRVFVSDVESLPIAQWEAFIANDTSFEIPRGFLKASTSYFFKLQAVNDFGDGLLSEPYTFTTPPGGIIHLSKDTIMYLLQVFSVRQKI
jgi:hypothetical protein